MADKQSTKPPAGTRDFLPDEIRRREYVIDVIRRVYESYGFEPLETPAFENIETLLGKYGEEGNKLIFKILKRGEHEKSGEADLALRYDLTVPLARVVAQYQNEIPKFFKRYQIQPVWRADRPAKGRFREFYQCDIDSLGSTSAVVEAELLSAVCDVLVQLGFQDFVVRLNHRGLLTALLETAGIAHAQHGDALIALDKFDKIGRDGVEKEFAARGMTAEATSKALTFFSGEPAASDATLARLAGIVGPHDAIANLGAIVSLLAGTEAGRRIRIDPSLARGLSYYTGAIMEVTVLDLAGSLGGGGRYDNLIGMFLGRDIPACGFSLGLERIIVVMTERNMFPPAIATGGADVLVTMWEDGALRADAVRLAAELRGAGLRVELYPEPDKIGKQFKYADDRHVRFVAVQGENERAAGTVTLKNLTTGTQESIARADAPAFVARTVNREPRT
jgi:histidyl-tRNA synthetase